MSKLNLLCTRLLLACNAALLLLLAPMNTSAAEIKMLASNAVKEGYVELIHEFESRTDNKVNVEWGGTVDITQRIRTGAVADVVIIPAAGIDNLISEGLLTQGRSVDLARSRIGAAVRLGLPKPSIASVEELKTTLLAAKSVVLSSGPSSGHLERFFQQMGIEAEIKSKTLKLKPGASVAEALGRGEGDLGFTQISELLTHRMIEYLGPLPLGEETTTTWSAGVRRNTQEPRAAQELLRMMTSAHAASELQRIGLEAK